MFGFNRLYNLIQTGFSQVLSNQRRIMSDIDDLKAGETAIENSVTALLASVQTEAGEITQVSAEIAALVANVGNSNGISHADAAAFGQTLAGLKTRLDLAVSNVNANAAALAAQIPPPAAPTQAPVEQEPTEGEAAAAGTGTGS